MCLNKRTNISSVTAEWSCVQSVHLWRSNRRSTATGQTGFVTVRRPSLFSAGSLVGTFVGGGRCDLEWTYLVHLSEGTCALHQAVLCCVGRGCDRHFGHPSLVVQLVVQSGWSLVFVEPINGGPFMISHLWWAIFWRSKPGGQNWKPVLEGT